MADSSAEVSKTGVTCPDTGQQEEVSSASSPSYPDESSNSEPSSTLSNQTPPKVNPFQGVRPAKFVPGVNVLGSNPFAPRPSLKSDVVSTGAPNQATEGAASQSKFILRPSALSSQPHNTSNDGSGNQSSAIPPILKPAKLPDPFSRSISKEYEGVTEKENKEASPVKEKPKPVPDSGGGGNGSSETTDSSKEETQEPEAKQDKEDRKQPDSSSSPNSTSTNHNEDKDNILGQNLTERVTGVHTSPKGLVSSSGFVFGENLADRVVQRSISEELAEDGSASPDSTEITNAEAAKSLEESAREYQATHGKKTELQEVEIVTGEEDESNVLQINGRLFVFDGDHQNWLERGRGIFRLNDMRCNSSAFQSRLLMRTQGSLRLILNTKVWPGMTVMRASQKSIRLTATDGDEGVKVFLLVTNPKDNENILRALDWRIQQLRVQEDPKDVVQTTTEKRKAEPESPTEDFIPKKAKKSPDEAFASFKREESDSSVIDPETEASSESHASSFTLRTDSD